MAREITPMAVILLGDMEFTEPAHIALEPIADLVWWIAGNHDTDNEESWDNLVNTKLAGRCLDGRVVTLADGTLIAGLSGVFREKVWAPPREPIWYSYEQWLKDQRQKHSNETLRHLSTIFPETIDRLSMESADILVTHEAPELHPYGWEVLSDLAEYLGVSWHFHGHHHDNLPYHSLPDYPSNRHVCGVGLRGITGRYGHIYCPGEKDSIRDNRL